MHGGQTSSLHNGKTFDQKGRLLPPQCQWGKTYYQKGRLEGGGLTTSLSSFAAHGQFLDGILCTSTLCKPSRRCIGVELSRSRHRNALKAVSSLAQELAARGLPCLLRPPPPPAAGASGTEAGEECGGGVLLRNGDVLSEGVLEDATVAYLASLCFSSDFMDKIAGSMMYRVSSPSTMMDRRCPLATNTPSACCHHAVSFETSGLLLAVRCCGG